MPEEVSHYSYSEELRLHRRRVLREKKAKLRRQGHRYEPRPGDERFVERLEAGFRAIGGDSDAS